MTQSPDGSVSPPLYPPLGKGGKRGCLLDPPLGKGGKGGWWHALLVAGLGMALVAGCLTAPFTTYDDAVHVRLNEQPEESAQLSDVLTPAANTTYFPVTVLSYRLDRLLFAGWMPGTALRSWAPGVRFMTLVYHAAAALLLWRILLQLGLSPHPALFVACVFAAHPLACETVCWVSERKNALAALFGFAALWAWLRLEGRDSRVPAATALYVLALLSKPSALGILPLFLLVELFGGAAGVSGAGPMRRRPGSTRPFPPLDKGGKGWWWPALLGRMALPCVVSLVALSVNLEGHGRTLLPPPGGSVFTALLTDLEILTRYLGNLVAPVGLSAAYFVAPVTTLADARVWLYGALLAAVAYGTIAVAENRRRAAFGWLWFLTALGPSLNLVAITHLMQDRYLYLSTPGFFIVVVEAACGVRRRLGQSAGSVLRVGAPVYVAALAALGSVRGTVWNNTLTVFRDAEQKQPQSSFVHYGLGAAYAQAWHVITREPGGDQQQAEECHRRWIEHWRKSLACPDAGRALFYSVMANRVGEELNAAGRPAEAERYWLMAAGPPPQLPDQPDFRAKALANLSALRLQQGQAEAAFSLATQAVQACDRDTTRLARARATLAWAEEQRRGAEAIKCETVMRRLAELARLDLQSIATSSPVYAEAQKLLEHPLLKP